MRKLFILSIIGLFPFVLTAQFNFRPSAYHQDMSFYNPSSLPGMNEHKHRILLYNRLKIVENNNDIWNKPPTTYVDYLNYNEEKKHGFSVSYMNDNYSFFSRNSLYAGFAKVLKLGEKTSFSFGGRLVLHTDIVNWSKYKLPHNESGRAFKLSPDADIGTQFQWRGFKLGASVKNLIGLPQKLDGQSIIKTQHAFIFNTSYDINIKDKVVIAPYALLSYEMKSEIDVGLYLNVLKTISASYFIRINELRSTFMLEARLYKGFSMGACYDMSPIKPDNNLDIFIRYYF